MSSTTKKKLKPNLEVKVTPKKVSKTWLAFEKHIGSGVILDMRAVLK